MDEREVRDAIRRLSELDDESLDGLIQVLEETEPFKPPALDERARARWRLTVSRAMVARAEREVRKNRRAAQAAQSGGTT